MSLQNKPLYSIAAIEQLLNGFIHFVFYYRLILVTAAIATLAITSVRVWKHAAAGEQIKSISIVFGLGSVVIGIFYAILNYENNQLKYRKDEKKAMYTLCYHSVSEWHQPGMVANLKITRQLYDQHQHLIDDNRGREFFEILEQNEAGRSALVSILNYFECISMGIRRGLLDDDYMRSSFMTIAHTYLTNYGFYIKYRRAVHRSPSMWINFTNMVESWEADVGSLPGSL